MIIPSSVNIDSFFSSVEAADKFKKRSVTRTAAAPPPPGPFVVVPFRARAAAGSDAAQRPSVSHYGQLCHVRAWRRRRRTCLYLYRSQWTGTSLQLLGFSGVDKAVTEGAEMETRNELKTSEASRLSKQTRVEGRGSGHRNKLLMCFPQLFMTNWGEGGVECGVGEALLGQEETGASCFDSVFHCRLKIPGIYERSPPPCLP